MTSRLRCLKAVVCMDVVESSREVANGKQLNKYVFSPDWYDVASHGICTCGHGDV